MIAGTTAVRSTQFAVALLYAVLHVVNCCHIMRNL